MYNELNGRENHLIKLDRMKDYKPPLKTDEPEVIKKKLRKRKRKSEPNKSNKKIKITDFFQKSN